MFGATQASSYKIFSPDEAVAMLGAFSVSIVFLASEFTRNQTKESL